MNEIICCDMELKPFANDLFDELAQCVEEYDRSE